jgi:hypothetical protein
MIEAFGNDSEQYQDLPGRPVRFAEPRQVASFHTYLLLILGIGLIGAGISVIGFAVGSVGAVGVGAGAEVAAGLISISLFLGAFARDTAWHSVEDR